MKTKKIAIIGGGTAGWVAANHLGVELSRDPDIEITLIESKDIPVIGVGEGTVPRIKNTLKKFGISELELIASCDMTFKQGVKFANWMDPATHGVNNAYYHPFSPPYPQGFDLTNYWLNNREKLAFSSLSEFHCVANDNKSPKQVSSPPYEGVVDYAYHFDAAKFSLLLSKNARDKFGVKHLFEMIQEVKKAEDGSIKSLVYSSGQEQAFDFYVDCTGFASVLSEKTLKIPFVDKSHQILTDTALVYRQASTKEDEILPYTLSTAHQSGWVWDIPLTTRRGMGFVFASDFMNEDQAVEAFSRYVGQDLSDQNLRKVPMKIGYREHFWVKNCVSLGLAQGFVEPLEATSILVTDFSANLLARNFPYEKDDMPLVAEHCNRLVQYTWERVIDFVQLHYAISDRKDTEFWRANTDNPQLSDLLQERLEYWRIQPPQKSDFFSRFDIFGPENYLYILYGMHYPTRANALTDSEKVKFRDIIAGVRNRSEQMSNNLLSHRKWLVELEKAMAQR